MDFPRRSDLVTDYFTISAGGPGGDNDVPDGVYPMILTAIGEPKTVTARRGPKAGQDIDLIDWTFAIDSPGHPLDGRELTESTSTASGPRSKMYSYITALSNGVAPPPNARVAKAQLIGRRALGTVNHDEGGWPRIANLGALPLAMQQERFAQATGAPVVQPVPNGGVPTYPTPMAVPSAPVAAGAQPARDDLPF
jgi:hypothetical protein